MELQTASPANLKDLADSPFDDVVALGEEDAPDYRALYYRWERQQWQAGAIDLAEDADQWRDALDARFKAAFLWILGGPFVGGERVTSALGAFVDAAPSEEHQVFLTTQLVDAARRTVFLDRFYSEMGEGAAGEMAERVDDHRGALTPGCRTLLLELLPDAAEQIHREPRNLDALVEGIVLCHLVIASTVELTTARFLLDHLRLSAILPGFRQGFTAIARDLARHATFGVRFLAEMVAEDRRHKDVIAAAVARGFPAVSAAWDPPEGERDDFDALSYGREDLVAFARASLSRRLEAIGVDLPD